MVEVLLSNRPSLGWKRDNRWSWAEEDQWDKVQKDAGVKTLLAQIIDLSAVYEATDFDSTESQLKALKDIAAHMMSLCEAQDDCLAELTDGE